MTADAVGRPAPTCARVRAHVQEVGAETGAARFSGQGHKNTWASPRRRRAVCARARVYFDELTSAPRDARPPPLWNNAALLITRGHERPVHDRVVPHANWRLPGPARIGSATFARELRRPLPLAVSRERLTTVVRRARVPHRIVIDGDGGNYTGAHGARREKGGRDDGRDDGDCLATTRSCSAAPAAAAA